MALRIHAQHWKERYGSSAVTSRLALGEALLGLQQPMHHQQLAHQVIQGLASGLPVRIADRPGGVTRDSIYL